MLRLPDRVMTPAEIEADLAAAVEIRLAERLDAARRRREKTEQDRTAKNARRAAGLRARHARILARRTTQNQDTGGSQPQDDETTPARGPGTALTREAVQPQEGER
jgi:hypothetical protein